MQIVFDISEDEIPIFVAESEEQLQILDEGLVRLERQPEDPQLLQQLFRAAHTLKGAAGMIAHKRLVELTHALEATFDGLRKSTIPISTPLVDACLETIDALRSLCAEVVQGNTGLAQVEPLVEQLALLSKVTHPGTENDKTNNKNSSSSLKDTGSTPDNVIGHTGDPVYIRALISPDSIASAARAFQLMLTLQEMGKIVQMQPDQAVIESARPVQEFSAVFISDHPISEVIKALNLISEVDQIAVANSPTDILTPSLDTALEDPPAVETKEVRLGNLLIQNGSITPQQLEAAIQMQQMEKGPSALLGQTLVRLGYISQEVLDQVVSDQSWRKLKAQRATKYSFAESGKAKGGNHNVAEKTVRTSIERLDNLMNLVGELITDRNRLNLLRANLEARFHGQEQIDALAEAITHVGRITDQLQSEVMSIRMLAISNVFNKFPRLVRDLSRKAGKQIDLVIRGEDTELDRSVIETISDPLIHLLRNAVDHGIENPDERLVAGKPERGIILLTARHEQGRIIITVEDNGRGIDVARVKAKAVEKGLISQAEADVLSDEEGIELIFAPGLSTARILSDVSGRGVGMDIVRNNIERLNGSILVENWPGRGSQFQIILPLTLAIVPTLMVRIGDQISRSSTYAIPLVTVTETLRVPVNDIQTVNTRPVIVLRGHVLPVVRLEELFYYRTRATEASAGAAKTRYEYIVVVRSGKAQIGLIVDALIGEEEVVVKSLSSAIGEINGISSAAILGDGQVALILDVQGLFKLAAQHTYSERRN
jgi:two-component system chemotaxis sensor kinase CheA